MQQHRTEPPGTGACDGRKRSEPGAPSQGFCGGKHLDERPPGDGADAGKERDQQPTPGCQARHGKDRVAAIVIEDFLANLGARLAEVQDRLHCQGRGEQGCKPCGWTKRWGQGVRILVGEPTDGIQEGTRRGEPSRAPWPWPKLPAAVAAVVVLPGSDHACTLPQRGRQPHRIEVALVWIESEQRARQVGDEQAPDVQRNFSPLGVNAHARFRAVVAFFQ